MNVERTYRPIMGPQREFPTYKDTRTKTPHAPKPMPRYVSGVFFQQRRKQD